MKCKTCNGATFVIDSRYKSGNQIRRRRECEKCGQRVTTFECEKQDDTKVQYTQDILDRANLRGLTEYLMYGKLYDEDKKTPEEKIEAAYAKFDDLAEGCCNDKDSASMLQDCASDLAREVSEVYMQIGLEAGLMLIGQIRLQ